MLNQLKLAVEPHLPLARVIGEWSQVSRSLAEPPRRRIPQIDRFFTSADQTS